MKLTIAAIDDIVRVASDKARAINDVEKALIRTVTGRRIMANHARLEWIRLFDRVRQQSRVPVNGYCGRDLVEYEQKTERARRAEVEIFGVSGLVLLLGSLDRLGWGFIELQERRGTYLARRMDGEVRGLYTLFSRASERYGFGEIIGHHTDGDGLWLKPRKGNFFPAADLERCVQ